MGLTDLLARGILLLCLTVFSLGADLSEAADKTSGTILACDALTTPGQPATIEVRLNGSGLVAASGLGGEPLDLLVHGEVVGTGMTGGDGRAFLRYNTTTQGVIPAHVRIGRSSRVSAEDESTHVAVWEQRNPIVTIEVTALMDPAPPTSPAIGLTGEPLRKSVPHAADELAKLTRFYYRVIYVVSLPASGTDRFRANVETRKWLNANRFPPGYILVLPPGEDALGAKLDELHAEGWRTAKIGIGRSRAFVDVFIKRRLEAIMLLDSATGDAPGRAKVVKNWKEVRKHF